MTNKMKLNESETPIFVVMLEFQKRITVKTHE